MKRKHTCVEKSEEEVYVCGGEKKREKKERKKRVWMKINKEIKGKIK